MSQIKRRWIKHCCCWILTSVIPVNISKAQLSDHWSIPMSKILAVCFLKQEGKFYTWNVWLTETSLFLLSALWRYTFHVTSVTWYDVSNTTFLACLRGCFWPALLLRLPVCLEAMEALRVRGHASSLWSGSRHPLTVTLSLFNSY